MPKKLTFKEYMKKVDETLTSICGMSHNDIGDYLYYDAYDAEVPPDECAEDALSNDDTFQMFGGWSMFD